MLFPTRSSWPIDATMSVPISTWPARIGSSTCPTRFCSCVGERRALCARHLAHPHDRHEVVRVEHGAVELERRLGVAHEVEVGAHPCHRRPPSLEPTVQHRRAARARLRDCRSDPEDHRRTRAGPRRAARAPGWRGPRGTSRSEAPASSSSVHHRCVPIVARSSSVNPDVSISNGLAAREEPRLFDDGRDAVPHELVATVKDVRSRGRELEAGLLADLAHGGLVGALALLDLARPAGTRTARIPAWCPGRGTAACARAHRRGAPERSGGAPARSPRDHAASAARAASEACSRRQKVSTFRTQRSAAGARAEVAARCVGA